jgi:hypothetical protein
MCIYVQNDYLKGTIGWSNNNLQNNRLLNIISHDNITTITTLHQQASNQLMACSHTPVRSIQLVTASQEENVCTVLQYAAL